MSNLNFTANQVYVGKLATLSHYDAVKYDRKNQVITFFNQGTAKVVFDNINSVEWRDFENQYRNSNFFDHKTQWAWFKSSAIINSSNPTITPRNVSVNFDTTVYTLTS